MKKSLIAVIALFCLSMGILIVSNSQINAKSHSVTVEENTLFGDKSFAKGISIVNRTHYDHHLFWTTTYSTEEAASEYKFSPIQLIEPTMAEADLSIYDTFNFGMSGTGLTLDEDEDLALKPAKAVAERTPAGESRTERLLLSDFYEYYPITANLTLPDKDYSYDPDLSRVFSKYLKFPIIESHQVDATVTKNQNGQITAVEMSSENSLSFYSKAIIDDGGCYFAFMTYSLESIKLPQQVSGIHYLPFAKKGTKIEPLITEMDLVYPIDPEKEVILDIAESSDHKKLYLFTRRESHIHLTVIDKQTAKALQQITLPNISTEEIASGELGVRYIIQQDSLLIPLLTNDRFYLFSEAASDSIDLSLEMTGTLEDIDTISFRSIPNLAIAYDGNRLAMVFYKDYDYSTSTYLLVYQDNALAYAGSFLQSSDKTVSRTYNERVRHLDNEPLTIIFNN